MGALAGGVEEDKDAQVAAGKRVCVHAQVGAGECEYACVCTGMQEWVRRRKRLS